MIMRRELDYERFSTMSIDELKLAKEETDANIGCSDVHDFTITLLNDVYIQKSKYIQAVIRLRQEQKLNDNV